MIRIGCFNGWQQIFNLQLFILLLSFRGENMTRLSLKFSQYVQLLAFPELVLLSNFWERALIVFYETSTTLQSEGFEITYIVLKNDVITVFSS